MSEAPDKESKTEKASEKKVRDAIDKGNIPVSREASTFASIAALVLALQFFAAADVTRMAQSLRMFLDNPAGWRLENSSDVLMVFREVGWNAVGVLLPVITLLLVAGLAASFLQNIPQLVGERIKPEWSRVSLFKGWTRIFGIQGQVEFLKGVFKFAAVAGVGWALARTAQFDVFNAMYAEPHAVPELLFNLVKAMFIAIGGAALALMLVDLLWSRFHWAQELRMTKQEVKDELKQLDGDPLLKSRMRSLARDRSRKRMIASVPRATLVIANPTHFAVALRYVREEGGAPLVIAKGQDLVALKIREIAEANNIPVVEDKPLARALYDVVEVDRFIPREFYKAVAEIIMFLSMRAGGRRAVAQGRR